MCSQMVAGRILETIGDGDWHSLEQVAEKLKASVKDVVDEVITLSQFGILDYNEKAGKMKLSRWVLNLSEKDELGGKKSAVGSIILPPGAYVTVQNIVMSNFLDEPVELGIKMGATLKEVSISKAE